VAFPGSAYRVMVTLAEASGGCHAAVIDSSPVLGCCLRHQCFRQHSRGAKLRRDDVHDVVQFTIGGMPDHLLGSRHATDRRGDGDQQCERKHDVPAELLDATDILSVGLLASAASCPYRGTVAGADNGSSGAVISVRWVEGLLSA
jgi:hypothetical protein